MQRRNFIHATFAALAGWPPARPHRTAPALAQGPQVRWHHVAAGEKAHRWRFASWEEAGASSDHQAPRPRS